MSIDDTSVAETTRTEETPATSVNRRTLMKTAAGAGVAVAAAGLVGAGQASSAPRQTAGSGPAADSPQSEANPAAAPLVVHVSDLANGTLEIFTNGRRTQVTDIDLAHRIDRAAQ